MKHVSGFLGIFGGAVALAAAYFLMDYAAKEVTFAALIPTPSGTPARLIERLRGYLIRQAT